MCGIFFSQGAPLYVPGFNAIAHRGPDTSMVYEVDKGTYMGFHRLAINDPSPVGNQPFHLGSLSMVCNGEIYNHEELEKKYKFSCKSWSDCEIILHLFLLKRSKQQGISDNLNAAEDTMKELDGVYAFVIYDADKKEVVFGRDKFGIRPLFYSIGVFQQYIYIASEMKAIPMNTKPIQFPASSCSVYCLETRTCYKTLVQLPFPTADFGYSPPKMSPYPALKTMDLLYSAVLKRVKNTDKPIGCFLSGGVDSAITTIMTWMAFQELNKPLENLEVFTIGFEGADSEDIKYAKQLVKALPGIGKHHVYTPSIETGIAAIPRVIYHLESWDITTIRASVPQYLLSQYIRKNTNIRVLISGEGSDELLGGYMYFQNAPNEFEFRKETRRLLDELMYYDVLRTDRTTAANGLEVRVPFLDLTFTNHIQREISIKDLMLKNGSMKTKMYLRVRFIQWFMCAKDSTLLNSFTDVIYRKKDAFSDAVGHSWVDTLKQRIPELYSCSEKEYYMRVFSEFYPDMKHVIPRYWMPKWQDESVDDPSARFLSAKQPAAKVEPETTPDQATQEDASAASKENSDV